MTRRLLAGTLASVWFVASVAAGCGSLNKKSSTHECCLNGSFYDCPSSEDLEACSTGEEHDCEREPSRDDECDD